MLDGYEILNFAWKVLVLTIKYDCSTFISAISWLIWNKQTSSSTNLWSKGQNILLDNMNFIDNIRVIFLRLTIVYYPGGLWNWTLWLNTFCSPAAKQDMTMFLTMLKNVGEFQKYRLKWWFVKLCGKKRIVKLDLLLEWYFVLFSRKIYNINFFTI